MQTNLASTVLGTEIVFATDEWFAVAENLLKTEAPVFKPDLFTEYGKWMDGWESRRKRTEGNDWCVIKLGIPGIIHSIEVDTRHFTGNYVPACVIRGAYLPQEPEGFAQLMEKRRRQNRERKDGRMGLCATAEEHALVNTVNTKDWDILVPESPLGAGTEETHLNTFIIDPSYQRKVSHIRLDMGPDGGIARLRINGRIVPDIGRIPANKDIDLAAIELGSTAVAWSDTHFGHPNNMISPGRGNCMGDGWETARQPKRPFSYQRQADGLMLLPGCDWTVFKLGVPGRAKELIIDTNFFKGNYPESCMVEGCYLPDAPDEIFSENGGARVESKWKPLLKRVRLGPNAIHKFPAERIAGNMFVSHVRITIYPDGGIMRFRLIGQRAPESRL